MQIANFGVEEWLNTWEKKAKYDISQSSIEALTLKELIGLDGTSVTEYFEKLSEQPLDYGWIEGSDTFKELVASLYENVAPENILQTNGATGANLLALFALIEPGDHVVSMLPTYQQLYDIPKSLGAVVDFVELKEEDQWQLDLNLLKSKIRPNTKMICLNSANNPTGTLLDKTSLQNIVAMAKEVDAYIVVDEVYAPLAGDGEFVSIVDLYEKGIATNSLSKTYSVPGIRIGWTASSSEIAELFRKYRDYTMICGGVISDDLAVHALRNKEKIIERNKKIVVDNLAILNKWIAQEPRVTLVSPHYVSTSFIKLDIPQDDPSFCIDLLEATGVLLVPGTAFDLPGYARLGYCCKEETLHTALELLSGYLRKFD
ncbi:aminotransferase [Candidatus Enterococcus clewellii]|uniref:Aminotransferase n=1 Tax=Candidatus Enterococcus clewellii TaxID=1834193 RepID=A0A242KDB5_9ENTE|nr:aminotransferase [Enterococcus sp. 9E7_DIV0242]OTP19161.1 aspartate aminotransferase [Enterococcus sp. 9E7_DIV0242]